MVKLSDFLVEAAANSSQKDMEKNELRLDNTIKYLQTKKKVLLIGTSNRWEGHKDDEAKSTKLAKLVCERLGSDKCEFIDASKLNIFVCEGNVSSKWGNHCGEKGAVLKDKEKDPTGYHRCWASINNKSTVIQPLVNPILLRILMLVLLLLVKTGMEKMLHKHKKLYWNFTDLILHKSYFGTGNIQITSVMKPKNHTRKLLKFLMIHSSNE